MENVVYVATKKIGSRAAVGYFVSAADIPEGWTPAEQLTRDITDTMRAFGCTKESALKTMNAHWQE